MFWLIEDIEKIKLFCSRQYEEVYVEIIPTSPYNHPTINSVSCVYIRPLIDHKGYIIPISHSETINLPEDVLNDVFDSIGKIYVRDKKEFLHYFQLKNVYSTTPKLDVYTPEPTEAHTFFKNLYPRRHDLNNIVPIAKHYEICQTNYKNFKIGDINRFYNERAYIVYNMLERAGVRVDQDAYKRYFDKSIGEYAYTNYNLNTTTTRPSNTFGGINFSTLNKDTGERECFIPRNDIFIEMDVSAYHPNLLSHILHHDFGGVDIHMAFAELYGVDYQRSKEITFQQIYGGIWKQYEDLDFFKKVKQYTEEKWTEFNTQGYIKCDISGYIFEKDKLGEMNPQKLLNYILQERETSTNVMLMWDIFKVLRGLNTKLVLTVYDSFVLDLDTTEKYCILEIEKIFSKHNLTVKYKKGINYNFK